MKKEIVKFLVLVLIAAGCGPAGAAFWQWSKTAGTNASVDPSINWREGMAPSAVNDSARAMMARAAEYRDDIGGALRSTGTSTSYVVTTNQGTTSNPPPDGFMIAFTPHVTNGANALLSVDGGTTHNIVVKEADSSLAAATLVAGTPYRISWSSLGSVWVLQNVYGNPYSIPLGAILWSTLSTAPNSNFVAPSGQCISTTTYAEYWVAMGSPASGACPGGQFAILDMRGYTPAALDTLNASAAGRMTNSATGCGTAFTTVGAICANGAQSTTILTVNLPPYAPAGSVAVTSTEDFIPSNQTVQTSSAAGGARSQSDWGAGLATIGKIHSTGTLTGTAQGGTSTPMPRVQPTIGLIPYLRIL